MLESVISHVAGRVAQRIRRLTTNQEIPGSNPGVVEFFLPVSDYSCSLGNQMPPPFLIFSTTNMTLLGIDGAFTFFMDVRRDVSYSSDVVLPNS